MPTNKRYDIIATHTRTREHKPLVELNGGPFNGVEMTPKELEQLASVLRLIAKEAAATPCTGKHWASKKIGWALGVMLGADHGGTA